MLAIAPDDDMYDSEVHELALYNLGHVLGVGGTGIGRDHIRAIELFEECISEHGNPLAMIALADFLKERRNEGDIQRAVKLLERALDGGDNDATVPLAQLLTDARYGPPIDLDRGVQLYEEQILEYDDMASMVNLAEVLGRQENRVLVDIPRAIDLCERSILQALQNNKEALEELGIDVKKPRKVRLAHKASRMCEDNIDVRWYVLGMCNLANILFHTAPEKNVERILTLFKWALQDALASEMLQEEPVWGYWQNDEARLLVHNNYFESLRKTYEYVREDEELCPKAVVVFELAVRRTGSSKLMCLLAEIFLNGAAGIARDARKAINLYKRAVFKENTSAMLALGELLCVGGPGVHADRRQAIELFTRIIATEEEGVILRSAIVNLAISLQPRCC